MRALNLDQIYGLQNAGLGGEIASVETTPCGGDDLTTAAMDGIGVKGHVLDVETDPAHVLIAHNTF